MSEFIKHHHIKFKEGPAGNGVGEWASCISEVEGVSMVKIDRDKKDIYVEYDLEKCSEEAIEHWMVKAGFVLDDSFMERMKRGFIHYTEENARDNLGSKPHSCCDVEETESTNKDHK